MTARHSRPAAEYVMALESATEGNDADFTGCPPDRSEFADELAHGGDKLWWATDVGAIEPSALITVCSDGPLLVRGNVRIVDSSGAVLPQNRQTIALCRCGKSRIAPLCDGTHKLLRSREGGPAGARKD